MTPDQLTVIGIVATVVVGTAALVVPIVIYRRQAPKRELWFSARSSSLMPRGASSLDGRLSLHLDKRPVVNPHVTTFRLWSTGRADIPSALFDAGRSLTFNLGTEVVGSISQQTADQGSAVQINITDGVVEIAPSLIRKSFASEFRLITSGHANITMDNPLVDVRVSRIEDLMRRERSRVGLQVLAMWGLVLGSLVGVGVTVWAILNDQFVFALVVVGISTLVSLYVILSARTSRSQRLYRASDRML